MIARLAACRAPASPPRAKHSLVDALRIETAPQPKISRSRYPNVGTRAAGQHANSLHSLSRRIANLSPTGVPVLVADLPHASESWLRACEPTSPFEMRTSSIPSSQYDVVPHISDQYRFLDVLRTFTHSHRNSPVYSDISPTIIKPQIHLAPN